MPAKAAAQAIWAHASWPPAPPPCVQVAAATGLRHLNIGDLVKSQELHSGWDDEFECWVIDEDKVGGPRALLARRGA